MRNAEHKKNIADLVRDLWDAPLSLSFDITTGRLSINGSFYYNGLRVCNEEIKLLAPPEYFLIKRGTDILYDLPLEETPGEGSCLLRKSDSKLVSRLNNLPEKEMFWIYIELRRDREYGESSRYAIHYGRNGQFNRYFEGRTVESALEEIYGVFDFSLKPHLAMDAFELYPDVPLQIIVRDTSWLRVTELLKERCGCGINEYKAKKDVLTK